MRAWPPVAGLPPLLLVGAAVLFLAVLLPPSVSSVPQAAGRLVRMGSGAGGGRGRGEGATVNQASGRDPHGRLSPSTTPIPPPDAGDDEEEPEIPVTDQFWPSFATAFLVILVSELGDKTFLIAAILAMRHSRLVVAGAGLLALALMTVISAAFGLLLPSVIPRRYTVGLAALLFLVFGAKSIVEGMQMRSTRMREEYDEVSHEIEDSEDVTRRLEAGAGMEVRETESKKSPGAVSVVLSPSHPSGRSSRTNLSEGSFSTTTASSSSHRCDDVFYNYLARLLGLLHTMRIERVMSPVFLQTFSLIFLAEWGDRSQLATIALAAAQVSQLIMGVALSPPPLFLSPANPYTNHGRPCVCV